MCRLIAMTAALMIGGAIVLDLLAGIIIRRVFGPDYEGAIEIFRWAVWLSVPAGIEAIGNLVVLKYQAKFVLLAKWLLALAVALVVNLLAIPRMGATARWSDSPRAISPPLRSISTTSASSCMTALHDPHCSTTSPC